MTFLICFGKPIWFKFRRYPGATALTIGWVGLWVLYYDFEVWLSYINEQLKKAQPGTDSN